jgi:hypothetical protein
VSLARSRIVGGRLAPVEGGRLTGGCGMEDIDTDRIDEAVLALLYLGRHDDGRTWKSFDWEAMNRLHEKGFISDPVGKAKSVVFTDEGERRSEALFRELFSVRR